MDATTITDPVMMICPNLRCRKVLQVPGRFRGQQVKCHYCTTTFSVPAPKHDQKGEGKSTGKSEGEPKNTAN